MPNTSLMLSDNLPHNVPAAIAAAKTRLTDLAKLYLVTDVAGQSQAPSTPSVSTCSAVLSFYHPLYG